jgi:hypothetical protein
MAWMRRVVPPLLASLVALHVLAQPIAAIAAAGWRADTVCCCPDQSECECPHGDHGNGSDMLRRCGDAGEAIPPALSKTVAPPRPIEPLAPRDPRPVLPAYIDEDPDEHWTEPETPPF